MSDHERDGKKFPSCSGCGAVWRQRGNSSGHCTSCHETFRSLSAFKKHQRMHGPKNVCLHPTEVGLVEWVDSVGAVQWKCAGGWSGPQEEMGG